MGRAYIPIVRVTDFGPYVTKLVLPLGEKILSLPEKDGFHVYVERKDQDGNLLYLPKSWMARESLQPGRGCARVRDAYISDREGNRQEEGSSITLELFYGPMDSITAELYAPDDHEYSLRSEFRITQLKDFETEEGTVSGLVFDMRYEVPCRDYQDFRESVTKGEMPFRYGYFVPQGRQEKKPLIIWLHGAGEGGYETKIAYMGNKVTAMASSEIQEVFGGAYLFVPQCETMWMDDGSHTYGRSGRSMYGKGLKDAIDEFLDLNPGIDRRRIYIGGDSNGGFMTMRMAIDYPGFFAAAFPVCEALYDSTISDAEIQELKKLPIWFTHSKNDPVVNPEESSLATYRRLKAAGARNLHFSFFDRIIDQHMGWTDEEGKPFEYIGHFAWIPLFNRDCSFDFDGEKVLLDGKAGDLFDWLARQSLHK